MPLLLRQEHGCPHDPTDEAAHVAAMPCLSAY